MKELIQIIRFLSFKRIFNFFSYTLSIAVSSVTRKAIVLNQPYGLSVEASAICNLKCPECPLSRRSNIRKNKIMPTDIFRKIILEADAATFYLNLYFQGEPLMDKDIFEKIKFARSKRFFVTMSTNATMLDDTACEKIVDSGLSKIIISADGIKQKSLEKYRYGANIQNIISNIETLKKMKSEKKQKLPLVELQMIVFKHNEDEISDYKKIMRKAGADIITFKSAQFYNKENATANISTLRKYRRYKLNDNGEIILESKSKKICKRLWHTLLINSDGDVPICCFDKNINHKIANVETENIRKLWKNKKYMAFRKSFLNNKKIDICYNCE